MNIVFDLLNNCVVAASIQTKKDPLKIVTKTFSYSLNTPENKVKALNEVLNSQDILQFNNDLTVSLLMSDDILFTGCMQFPPFSGGKLYDAFETRFKICYPNYTSYYLNYSVFEKNNANSMVLYSIAKAKLIEDLKNIITKHNKTVKSIDYLSDLFKQNNKTKTEAINAKLLVGEANMELLIFKGKTLISSNFIELGTKVLFEESPYLDSTYNINSDLAYKYSSLHILNYETKDSVNDESIRNAQINDSLNFSDPREVRLLKGDSLANYCLRQNIRRVHAHILDVVQHFSQTPWFFPIHEVEVVGDKRVLEQLLDVEGEKEINYIQSEINIENFFRKEIPNNVLFTKILKQKERRKIDWQKFLSMEIGKKKKA